MTIESCSKCGNRVKFYMQHKGNNIGMYCLVCGGWKTWVGKAKVKGYQNRGIALYQEGEYVPLVSTPVSENQDGVEEVPRVVQEVAGVHDGVKPTVVHGDIYSAIERENERVEARVQIEKAKLEKAYQEKFNEIVAEKTQELQNDEEINSKGCAVCNGEVSLENNVADTGLDIGVYSGIMSVTQQNNDILGMYTLKYCPECGKRLGD